MSGGGSAEGAVETMTVMITDIENSTWLWEHHTDDMAIVIPEHHRLMASAIGRTGTLVKSTGDGVLAVFADPPAAVACAVDVQRAVAGREWTGVGRLGVRIGIHTGLCSLIDGDVLGRPPNLAARLESAGHGGQILVSGDTAAACTGRLAAGVELHGLGAYTMRGFDDPVEVHVVRADGLITDFPPPRAAYRGFEDLPPDDRPLVGRSAAIRLAADAVGTRAVVTLWGPAGVGKTRLAVRVATAARHPFDDGIRFVDLTTTGRPRTVADAVLDALRVQPASGESAVDTLRRAVRSLRILLVLDNCEHVLDEVRSVVDLIVAASPGTHVLCTSREPLGLAGESTIPVAPLAEVDAVRLFVSRVTEVRPEFDVTASTGNAVRRICAATDGLPYAIELAAAQVVVEGVEAAAATPDVGSSAAAGGGLDGRLERSLATLEPSASALLTQLAVFVGPFSHDLARAVAPEASTFESDLARLVRGATVVLDEHEQPYRVLTPVRTVVRRRAPAEVLAAAADRHAAAMVARAEHFEALLRSDGQAEAVRVLQRELAEHAAAFEHLLASGSVADAARLVGALFQFGLFQPRPEVQRWAVRVAERIGDDDPRASAILGSAALAAWYAGDTTLAIDLGRQAVATADRTGGSARWARTALVDALGYAGRLDELVPHYVALVGGLGRDPDPYWRVNGLGLEAISLALFGRHDEGQRKAGAALALARSTGNPESLHWGSYALGRTLIATDPAAACEAFEQSMRWSSSVDSRFNVGIALVEWVALKRQVGDEAAAVAGSLDLLGLLAVSGQRSQLSQALRECGLLLATTGRHEQAAVALLARDGMPAMPRGEGVDDPEVRDGLADLEGQLGPAWGRIVVRAQTMTEPELVDHVRSALVDLQTELGRPAPA